MWNCRCQGWPTPYGKSARKHAYNRLYERDRPATKPKPMANKFESPLWNVVAGLALAATVVVGYILIIDVMCWQAYDPSLVLEILNN